jgi:hypothetical protein
MIPYIATPQIIIYIVSSRHNHNAKLLGVEAQKIDKNYNRESFERGRTKGS